MVAAVTSVVLLILAMTAAGTVTILCLWAVAALASNHLNAFVVDEAMAEAERGGLDKPAPREPAD